jgi:ricin-type beta-trefoil lectin protein
MRTRIKRLLVVLAALAVITVHAIPSSASAASSYGPYLIINDHSHMCPDVSGGNPTSGVQVQQWDCWGNADQALMQQWQEVQLGDNLVQFKNRATGKCIDDPGGSLIRGTILQQWDCWGGAMAGPRRRPCSAGAAAPPRPVLAGRR